MINFIKKPNLLKKVIPKAAFANPGVGFWKKIAWLKPLRCNYDRSNKK